MVAILILTVSCGSGGQYTADAKGFEQLQNDLKTKFGENAYYTEIGGSYISEKSIGKGIILGFTVTKEPESFKMQQWSKDPYSGWRQTADVTIEVPQGVNPKEFMFKLDSRFDLKKVGEMIEKSIKKLADEKQIKAVLDMFSLKPTEGVKMEETKVFIFLKPENGGTSFSFQYDLDGNLLDFDY